MEILRTVCLAAVALAATSQSLPHPEVVAVTAVIDGQTIVVAGHGRVRLAGIAAPAIARGVRPGAPYGRQAKERLEGIVIQRFVRLVFDSGGRRAFVLLEDGTCVNATLVREGLARVESARGTRTACSPAELNAAEAQARAMRRGIWST